jgi:uncharacterized protein (TIGR02448 family)
MPPLRLLAITLVLSVSSTSHATSFVVTTDTIGAAVVGTTDASVDISSSLIYDKIVLAARDDAAGIVASRGDIRGAQLEAALVHIRQQLPQLLASDLQLAQAILAR